MSLRLSMLFALLCLFATGCEHRNHVFHLNPDGSGKVEYKATFPLDVQSGPGNKDQTDAEKVKKALAKVLGKSKGVAAWANPACRATEEGLIEFTGTAYFRDFNALKIAGLGGQESKNKLELNLEKAGDGYTISGRHKKKKKKEEKPAEKVKDWKTELRRTRNAWKYMRHMVGMSISNDMQTYTFHLAGPAAAYEGFVKTGQRYSYTFDGEKLYKAMDSFFAKSDEELMALIKAGVDPTDEEAFMKHAMKELGLDLEKGLRLEVKKAKPLFDFAGELKKVNADYARFCAKHEIGLSGDKPVEATAETASKGNIQSALVQEISRSFVVGENKRANASISVHLTFDGVVTACDKATITRTLDQDGQPLEKKGTANINLRSRSGNKAARLDLNIPVEEGTTGFSLVEGTTKYSVCSGSRIVDLGVMELKKGAKGKAIEAEIRENDGGWLKLAFNAKETEVKAVQVFTPDGKPYDASQFSGQIWDGKYQKTMRPPHTAGDKWPEKLHFKVELYTETKDYTATWSTKGIQLPSVGK